MLRTWKWWMVLGRHIKVAVRRIMKMVMKGRRLKLKGVEEGDVVTRRRTK